MTIIYILINFAIMYPKMTIKNDRIKFAQYVC